MSGRLASKPLSVARAPRAMIHAIPRVARSGVSVAVASVAFFASAAAFAQNLGFMHSSPITYMRDKDVASLSTALHTALDNNADGQATEWTNEGLANSVAIKATITPKDSVDQSGMHCRHAAVTLNAKSQDQSWQPLFCKTAQGWKIQKH